VPRMLTTNVLSGNEISFLLRYSEAWKRKRQLIGIKTKANKICPLYVSAAYFVRPLPVGLSGRLGGQMAMTTQLSQAPYASGTIVGSKNLLRFTQGNFERISSRVTAESAPT
jgi:hypothetical protein